MLLAWCGLWHIWPESGRTRVRSPTLEDVDAASQLEKLLPVACLQPKPNSLFTRSFQHVKHVLEIPVRGIDDVHPSPISRQLAYYKNFWPLAISSSCSFHPATGSQLSSLPSSTTTMCTHRLLAGKLPTTSNFDHLAFCPLALPVQ